MSMQPSPPDPAPAQARSDLAVVLWSPRIPQNVGAIGRLCAAATIPLHLVRPLPFRLDQVELRRAGMDYWHLLECHVHTDWAACRETLAARPGRRWLFTTRARQTHWEVTFKPGDVLVFGNEPNGAPQELHSEIGLEHSLRIPHWNPEARSLNLAQACAVAVYEALRQIRHE